MEDFIYYFYNYKVETATVEINLPGWQKLTDDEIEIYKSGNYHSINKFEDRYCFSSLIDTSFFDFDQYKLLKIQELSQLSLSVGEDIAPTYRFHNCLLSKEMEENGEIPIYSNWREVMQDFKIKRINLRNEFYRLKSIIENAADKNELDLVISEKTFR